MLNSIFAMLSLTTFALLASALYNINTQGRRAGSIITFILVAVLFGTLALNAMNLETVQCDNQVLSTTVSGNVTTYTNNLSCTSHKTKDQGLAALYSGLALASIVMLGIYLIPSRW